MSSGSSNSRTLILVAAIVVVVAVGVTIMKGRGGDDTTAENTDAAKQETKSGNQGGDASGQKVAAADETHTGAGTTPEGSRTVKPSANSPDILFVDWDFSPETPIQGKPVRIRASIKNDGAKPAPAFNVAWHASADQSAPEHVWAVPKLNPGSRHTLEFEYAGYARGYDELKTMIVIDPEGVVVDKDRTNNEWVKTITVAKQ